MSNDWESGLFSCADRPGECCLAFWFPCVSLGNNVRFMEEKTKVACPEACACFQNPIIPNHLMAGGGYGLGVAAEVMGNCAVCSTSCVGVPSILQLSSIGIHTAFRNQIRKSANVGVHCCKGKYEGCEDLAIACLCTSCALVQEKKQLEKLSTSPSAPPGQDNSMMRGLLQPPGHEQFP